MKNCWQSVKGHPSVSQLKWWELLCIHEESPRKEEVLPPDFKCHLLCQITPHWATFLRWLLHASYAMKGSLSNSKRPLWARKCTSKSSSSVHTWKSAKTRQQSTVVCKRYQALPWHIEYHGLRRWIQSHATTLQKGRVQTKQETGCKEQRCGCSPGNVLNHRAAFHITVCDQHESASQFRPN